MVTREDESGDRRALSWKETTEEWRAWLREVQETAAIFTNEEGDEKAVPLENRFMEKRQKRLYAKMKDVERGAREEFGAALNTVMLTFTASTTSGACDSGAGDWWRCPANHLDDLLGSWSAVRRALHRVLDGRDWEYVRMLEPFKSGHAHVHLALFVRGPVEAEDFRPVMETHVENCLAAGWDGHKPENSVAVERGVENIGAYLSEYLMKWDEKALDAPEHVQRFNALLWATSTRRWSASAGAREWAASPERAPPARDWSLTHIDVAGTRFPVEDGGGEVVTLAISGSAGLDPPPERDGPPVD